MSESINDKSLSSIDHITNINLSLRPQKSISRFCYIYNYNYSYLCQTFSFLIFLGKLFKFGSEKIIPAVEI